MTNEGNAEEAVRDEESMASAPPWRWLAPSLGYAVFLGFIGITTKLTLEHLAWQEMFLYNSLAYIVVAIVLVTVLGVRIHLTRGNMFAALAGFCAATGLLLLFIALQHADAGKVIPISAAYPVITAAVAVGVLKERITAARLIGTLAVVVGIAIIGGE